MKNIRIVGLLAFLCLLMQSCLFSEDDVFDESSAQRAMASVKECHEVLQSASNGWLLEYYPGNGPEYGGYNLIAKFDGKNVELASEMATYNYGVGETCTSLYKVASFQGTQLSFDGQNELIHMFCEPNGYNDPGYAGDYEFIFRTVSKEKIVLTGKKHGNTLIMTPLSADTDWTVFLNGVNRIKNDALYATYKLKIGGTEIVEFLRKNHALTIKTIDDRGQATITSYPFIYTDKGIRMLEPMKINGTEMSQFDWNSENRTFVCTDEGVDAAVEFYCRTDYPRYIGKYKMLFDGEQVDVTISQKIEGMSYVLSGLPAFNLEVSYNFDNDCIDLLYQYLGVYQGFLVYLCPWDNIGGYLSQAAGSGLSGTVVSPDGEAMTIKFKSNGVFEEANSLLFYAFSGGTGMGSVLRIPTPILQKIGN